MENSAGALAATETTQARQSWKLVLGLFCLTSIVETYGVSQVQTFLPRYLQALGVPLADVPQWTGTISSMFFLFGLPLVPLWGVWADKYSRKAVIVRSALVEAVVFAAVGFSQTPLQLAAAMTLVGFQLGNTGVMLAALRDLVPDKRLGLAVSTFGACGPVGLAVGPVMGGLLIDGLHFSYSQMYFVAAFTAVATALILMLAFREVRPKVIPQGPVLRLAFGAIGSVLRVPSTRSIFAIFGLSFLAYQMVFPFLPLVVQGLYGQRPGLDSAIGWVIGGAALLGAIVSPVGGVLGDRFGFRRVLVASMLGACVSIAIMPMLGSFPLLVADAVLLGACFSAFMAMIFSLLAVETPDEQRSSTLNLVYLPIYLAGVIGPLIGKLVVGLTNSQSNALNFVPLFLLGAAFYIVGLVPLLRGNREKG